VRAVINFLAYPAPASHGQLKDVMASIKLLYTRRSRAGRRSRLLVASYALPEAFIVEHKIVIVDQQVCYKISAAPGITILAVSKANILLGKRL
jgi:hypothetical protein